MVANPVFGEQVTYSPSGGSDRTIWAMVNRQRVELGQVGTLQYVVAVTNSDVSGVASPVLGKDTMTLKKHVGDASGAVAKVDEIVEQDAGGYSLLVTF